MSTAEESDVVIEDRREPPVANVDGDVVDESEEDEDIPPLEQIAKEMSGPTHTKNIVIPSDEEDKSKTEDDDEEDERPGAWCDILNNKELRKKVIKPGDGPRPTRGSTVAIRLVTRLYDENDDSDQGTGRVIATETFDRFVLVVGDNDLHQGLDLIVPLMDEGETVRAIVKPRFAYGPIGNRSAGIPEGASLDLEVELLQIVEQADGFPGAEEEERAALTQRVPIEERQRFGAYKKERGNFWFQRGDWSMAILCYRGALKYLDVDESELKSIDEERAKADEAEQWKPEPGTKAHQIDDLIEKRAQAFNNLAAAQMKLLAFDMALRSVDEALLLRPANVKALFRRAKIRGELGNVEDSIDDLKRALAISPESESLQLELDRMNRLLNKQLYEQRQLYRRMMQAKTNNKCKANFGDEDDDEDRAGQEDPSQGGANAAGFGATVVAKLKRFGLPAVGVLFGAFALQAIYGNWLK